MTERPISTLQRINEVDISKNKSQANATPLGKYLFKNSNRF